MGGREKAQNTTRQGRNRNGRGEHRGTREIRGRREGKPFPFFSACSAYSAVQFSCGKSSQLASNLDYCSAELSKSQLLFVMPWLCVLCVLLRPILDPRSVFGFRISSRRAVALSHSPRFAPVAAGR